MTGVDRCDDWDQHWRHYSDAAEENPAQSFRRELILDRLGAGGGSRVLDIGSGQGDLAKMLVTEIDGVQVLGLELGARGVEVASAKVPEAQFVQVDLLRAEEPVAPYREWATHVVCSEVLEHVDDPVRLLAAGLRYAAHEARVVVTVPSGPRTAFDRHIGHRRHFKRADLEDVLTGAGLEVERIDAAGFPFFNLYRLVVLVRGKKLIAEMSSDQSDSSRLASLALSFFRRLFALNRRAGRLGWQLVAVGRKPSSS